MATELYSIAGQTIFQIIGANGAPELTWESYPLDAVPSRDNGHWMDRSLAIPRSRQEFEAEQIRLRRGE